MQDVKLKYRAVLSKTGQYSIHYSDDPDKIVLMADRLTEGSAKFISNQLNILNEILEFIEEEIETERQELRDMKADKADMSSYGAGYSTGLIEFGLRIKELINGVNNA